MVRLTPFPEGKWLHETPISRIYPGFPYPIYALQGHAFSLDHSKLANTLIHALSHRQSEAAWSREIPSSISKSFAHAFQSRVMTLAESGDMIEKIPTPHEREQLAQVLGEVLEEFVPEMSNPGPFVDHVLDHGVGLFELSALLRDPELNEIMLNGNNTHIFVEHQKMGMCQTNIFIEENDPQSHRMILKAARYSGRNFSEEEPLLDARLPDGNRLNATFATITPQGHSMTIRKFRYDTLSMVDLIMNHTLTEEMAAYLWLMVEGFGSNPMNMIVSGGSGSGKTTLMNALGACIPYRERIITIEDTLELQFPQRENWVQMESKPAIVRQSTHERLGMDELLKNSLRMRPDRVIVGEVRGVEAQTLFAAMDTGHQGCMGTLHANSPTETLLRLSSEPMNVPKTLLPLLNVVVVTQKIHFPGEGTKRRIGQIAEISHLEREPLISNVFERKPEADAVLRTDTPSHCVQVLADATGKQRKMIQQELIVRQKILEWMLRQGIHTYGDVEKVLQQYAVNPVGVLERVQGQIMH